MKVAVVGGVVSTKVLLHALVRHRLGAISVWGYEPIDPAPVSGWCDLRQVATDLGLPFEGFRKVTECEASLRAFRPDILFVVGLSQILPPTMLSIAARFNVGFHPTALPRGRGRAALAWLILQGEDGAATFFELQSGVDDGPIFEQEPFFVTEVDDAADVQAKVLQAQRVALDRWLPCIARGEVDKKEQDHARATWFGRRNKEDGYLSWRAGRDGLLRLIRASAPPHPGAFTFCQDHRIVVLKARASERREIGVPGRILAAYADGTFEVQAGDGIIRVTRWQCDSDWSPAVGAMLGYYADAEIHSLRTRLERLERTLMVADKSKFT